MQQNYAKYSRCFHLKTRRLYILKKLESAVTQRRLLDYLYGLRSCSFRVEPDNSALISGRPIDFDSFPVLAPLTRRGACGLYANIYLCLSLNTLKQYPPRVLYASWPRNHISPMRIYFMIFLLRRRPHGDCQIIPIYRGKLKLTAGKICLGCKDKDCAAEVNTCNGRIDRWLNPICPPR